MWTVYALFVHFSFSQSLPWLLSKPFGDCLWSESSRTLPSYLLGTLDLPLLSLLHLPNYHLAPHRSDSKNYLLAIWLSQLCVHRQNRLLIRFWPRSTGEERSLNFAAWQRETIWPSPPILHQHFLASHSNDFGIDSQFRCYHLFGFFVAFDQKLNFDKSMLPCDCWSLSREAPVCWSARAFCIGRAYRSVFCSSCFCKIACVKSYRLICQGCP